MHTPQDFLFSKSLKFQEDFSLSQPSGSGQDNNSAVALD
jgi:hypothetical protein